MRISFNGIQYLQFADRKKRDSVKALEDESSNGNGDFWTAVKIDKNKGSSDLLILSGLDLEAAIENMADNQTVDDYVRNNYDKFIHRAEIHDYR